MDWDDLKVFLAVARNGTTRKAAFELGISASTINRRLASFEESLGTRLFDRFSHGYELTEGGEEMLDRAKRIERSVHDIERDLTGLDSNTGGVIRITVASGLLNFLLMPYLKKYGDDHPDTVIAINSTSHFVDLAMREADIAIRLTNNPNEHLPASLFGRHVTDARKAVYHATDYDTSDPEKMQWLSWDNKVNTIRWIREAKMDHIKVTHTFDDMINIAEAVRAGMGIAFLPCFVGDNMEGLQRMEDIEPDFGFELWVVTHQDLKRTARIRNFMKYIADSLNACEKQLIGK